MRCGPVLLFIVALTATPFINPLSAQDEVSIEDLKQQADDAYRQRNFSNAVRLASQVLNQDAEDHVALYLRGSSRVELGIVSGNAEMIRQGISDTREAIRIEAAGKPEYYLPYVYGMSHLAAIENKQTHAQTARAVVDSVLEREDLTPEQRANLRYQRAQANVQLKDFDAANADIDAALEDSPQHLASHMLRAEIAAKTKTPAEAVQAYSRVVQAFPDNPLIINNRGMLFQSLGRPQDALADFQQAIQIDSKFLPAYINRGFAYLEAGDANAAETAFTEALTIQPDHTGALSLRATARLNQDKASEALADYRNVTELAPDSSMAHADYGFAQFFMQDYQGALASFQKAMRLDSKMRFLKPWILASERALGVSSPQAYQDTLSKAPESRDWIDQLLLFQLGQLEATKLLQSVHDSDATARNAQLCEGYYFIGVELLRRGRTQDAIGYFQQASQRRLPKLAAYRGSLYALRNMQAK